MIRGQIWTRDADLRSKDEWVARSWSEDAHRNLFRARRSGGGHRPIVSPLLLICYNGYIMAEIGDKAVVLGLYMSPDQGKPMVSYNALGATEGRGLYDPANPDAEDRYAAGRGAWKHSHGPNTSREISIFPWEGLEAALEAAREAVGDPDFTIEEFALLTRRNIGVRGFGPYLSHLQDQELVDQKTGLRIKITNSCNPCDRPGHLAAKLDTPRNGFNLNQLLPGGMAGMRARTVKSGIFVVNQVLEII